MTGQHCIYNLGNGWVSSFDNMLRPGSDIFSYKTIGNV